MVSFLEQIGVQVRIVNFSKKKSQNCDNFIYVLVELMVVNFFDS